jgi:hypothetical protein
VIYTPARKGKTLLRPTAALHSENATDVSYWGLAVPNPPTERFFFNHPQLAIASRPVSF